MKKKLGISTLLPANPKPLSNWIKELMINNRSHSRHSDSLFKDREHYIIRFKDVTLEVIARKYSEVELSRKNIEDFLNKEIGYLTN